MNDDYAQVAELQRKFAEEGWRWEETTFSDSSALIRFTLNSSDLIFSEPNGAPFGWGRFQRLYAWQQAHDFLITEAVDKWTLDRLREYKALYRQPPYTSPEETIQ